MSDNDIPERLFIIFGCKPSELRLHIESQFVEGMTWNNYSFNGWHIDHIIPLFSAKKSEDLIILSHYSNLQPLWKNININKGFKYESKTIKKD
jgi:hypothetical protein